MVNFRKKVVVFLVVFFVLVIVLMLGNSVIKFWTGRVVGNYDLESGEINGSVWKKTIYHPEGTDLGWSHMPLNYFFNESLNDEEDRVICPDSQKERILGSFESIENETNGLISFVEKEGVGEGDIEIVCYNSLPFEISSSGAHLMRAEGMFRSRGDVINSAVLNFYNVNSIENKNRNCWDLELHEIFHIFGFRHVDDKKSLMYLERVGACMYDIDDWIIEDLIESYEDRFEEEVLLGPEVDEGGDGGEVEKEGFFGFLKRIFGLVKS